MKSTPRSSQRTRNVSSGRLITVTSCPRSCSPTAAWNIWCTEPVLNWLNSRIWKMRIAAIAAAIISLSCTTDATRRGYLRTIAEWYGPPPRPVIVVPGFGVTRLYDPVTRQYVWGTPRATVHTKYADDLDLPAGGGHDRLVPQGYVGSRGPVNIGWQLME